MLALIIIVSFMTLVQIVMFNTFPQSKLEHRQTLPLSTHAGRQNIKPRGTTDHTLQRHRAT